MAALVTKGSRVWRFKPATQHVFTLPAAVVGQHGPLHRRIVLFRRCSSTVAAAAAQPASTSNGDHQQEVAKPNIQDLAKMAQIQVSGAEAAEWSPKINGILDWFGQLQAVDVSGVQPAIHAYVEGNRLRADEPAVYAARSELVAQAAETERSYVRVPKTGSADSAASASSLSSSSSLGTGTPADGATAAAGAAPAAAASTSAAAAAPAADVNWEAVHALDIRVGRILSCEQHPDAESLYVEKIDVGEAEPRTIVSGLVKYVPLEQMQDRLVVVICNLKPRNMRGIKSFGMLLAASNAEHTAVEPLVPPPQAKAGERVFFGTNSAQPPAAEPKVMDKKKYWEAVQPQLSTDASCTAACAGGLTMSTSAGPIKSASLTGARIA